MLFETTRMRIEILCIIKLIIICIASFQLQCKYNLIILISFFFAKTKRMDFWELSLFCMCCNLCEEIYNSVYLTLNAAVEYWFPFTILIILHLGMQILISYVLTERTCMDTGIYT